MSDPHDTYIRVGDSTPSQLITAPEFRFIQITATPDVLYGLGNDGTVWRLVTKPGQKWFPLPGVTIVAPQPAVETSEP